jgi:hypothetical protein
MAVLLAGSIVLLVAASAVVGDEGMWLFTNPPRKLLEDKYKFKATDKWLDHVQKSSVRFDSGGSGSFVSPDGLVLTNHHVGLDVLEQISTEKKDYVKDGFYAKTRDAEVKAEHAELRVLMDIKDVTKEVNDAVKPGMTPAEAAAARRAIMGKIEDEAQKASKDPTVECNVVTLYQGGQYHLYTYKKYTDVRLVFAPEQQIAFYGGDPDNFEYPRYDLDMCIFRVYEDGKPVKVQNYLTWSKDGVHDDELVFVSGHPGRTDRLNTVADLTYQRDKQVPFTLQLLNRREVAYSSYSNRTAENARRAKETLFSVQNSRKAYLGRQGGLLDPSLFGQKVEAEKKLRAAVDAKPELKQYAGAWDKIAEARNNIAKVALRYNMLEAGRGFSSNLFGIGRTLLRAGEELPKPNGERLREFQEAGIKRLKASLFADTPIYDDFEIVTLADSLTFLAEQLGADSELVKGVLAGKSPENRAVELIKGSKLKDVSVRKKLFDGGKNAVDMAHDPMIELARRIDSEARSLRKVVEAESETMQQAYAQIAKARFAVEGTSTYPDATFTLRLAYGVVKGYEEAGKKVPYETTFAGLYERSKDHDNQPPFDLPQRWIDRKDKLNLKTPFNFVCTADIIGGNSGSPVINRDGELVGLIFDGNIQSLVLDFIYTEEQARAVAVCSQAMIEALRKVYDAGPLADELTGKR